MIIIADSHISKTRGNHTAFFDMLAAVEKTDHDLIFLGDIFDLWIALPLFEDDLHAEFLAWCRKRKNVRTVGFMEGNHEFFLASQRAQSFTWCSQDAWRRDDAGNLFAHGDQINRKDKKYLAFRKLTKNSLVKFLLQKLPYGPVAAASIKNVLNKNSNNQRLMIPRDEIEHFAEFWFTEGVTTVFMGHFHREYCYRRQESKELHVLPDWLSTQKVALYQQNPKKITMMHWKELTPEI
jgi:UDP-2,3-diacylglucosamine hydrolase